MTQSDYKKLAGIVFVFLFFYFVPLNSGVVEGAFLSGLLLLQEYVREHILTCLLPAFFIAGGISAFVKRETILRYLGGHVKKYLSYFVASVSGIILAVCSCTILPLFASIRKGGAGLGPATTFLFAGPAINVGAMFLTLSVLGIEIGSARIFFAILLAILVGITMQLIFREKPSDGNLFVKCPKKTYEVGKGFLVIFFLTILGILVVGDLPVIDIYKYILTALLILIVVGISIFKFKRELTGRWLAETWKFSKMLLPILFVGVFIAGFIMPFLPEPLIVQLVGTNSVFGNFIASIFGAFMYFSTLTEVPILQALIAKGMAQGPALALLLAGPSLSLPNMLVIRKVFGNTKTFVYILLVVFYSTIAGFIFGSLMGL